LEFCWLVANGSKELFGFPILNEKQGHQPSIALLYHVSRRFVPCCVLPVQKKYDHKLGAIEEDTSTVKKKYRRLWFNCGASWW